jgi:hypothetical protein
VLVILSMVGAHARARSELRLVAVDLDLPGTPASVVPADLDGDGRDELAVVVAYSEVGEVGEDRIEDMVQISVVIPALFDRRELRVYRRIADGYVPAAPPMELPSDVFHLESGPTGVPLVALRDRGLDALRLVVGDDGGPRLALEPLVEARTAFAGSRTFHTGLRLVHDLDGDGDGDVLLPAEDGLRVHRFLDGRPGPALPLPPLLGDRVEERPEFALRTVVLPEVLDVDGDGAPDLMFRNEGRIHVLRGTGTGTFVPLRSVPRDCHDDGTDVRFAGASAEVAPWPNPVATVRDVDGDGRAEVVTSREIERGGDGLRAGLKEARRPIRSYAVHELDPELDVVPDPSVQFRAVGHDLGGADGGGFPAAFEAFVDLDGDGRDELVTVTLDFSLFQAVRVLATKRISIGMEFHVHRPADDGTFVEVDGLDLTEKLKLNLNDLSFGRFAQFAGDFDGDGRKDFVHLGRGRRVTVHRGQDGAVYPVEPDLEIELREEPPGLELVRIEDLDGDGRADIRITRPRPRTDPDASAPARLELYLSGGGS